MREPIYAVLAGCVICWQIMLGISFVKSCLGRTEKSILKKSVLVLYPVSAAAFCGSVVFHLTALIWGAAAEEILLRKSGAGVFVMAAAGMLYWILLKRTKPYFTPENTLLDKMEERVMLVLLGSSMVLFGLILSAMYLEDRSDVDLILCAANFLLVPINVGMYKLLAALCRENRAEMESRLIIQQKNDQLRFEELRYQYEMLQKAKHDFKNSLQVLRSLNSERKPLQVEQYIESSLAALEASSALVITGNDYINAIVSAKTTEARKKGIDVENVVASVSGMSDPVDICNIIGNLFDNAIAACLKTDKQRRIRFRLYTKDSETVILMKNTIACSVLDRNPDLVTDKADRANHGYGTKIIRETAEKYHGFADFYEEQGEFCCHVVLYL